VIHVSQLKKKVGNELEVSVELPNQSGNGLVQKVPAEILERKLVQKGHASTVMVKVRWLNLPESENCWVDYYELKKKYPEIVANLSLEVKAFLMGGRNG